MFNFSYKLFRFVESFSLSHLLFHFNFSYNLFVRSARSCHASDLFRILCPCRDKTSVPIKYRHACLYICEFLLYFVQIDNVYKCTRRSWHTYTQMCAFSFYCVRELRCVQLSDMNLNKKYSIHLFTLIYRPIMSIEKKKN